MTDLQLTLDGREEPLPAVEPHARTIPRPDPLFAQEAFSARVPGTIALPTDQEATSMARYDGSPRDITEDEALALSREEYQLLSRHGQHHVLSRGADGGMHIRETFTRSQAAIVWMNTRRKDLRERLLAGKCQHTCFYDRSRDRFWIG